MSQALSSSTFGWSLARRACMGVMILGLALTGLSCGSDETGEECTGAQILPSASPVGLGSFYPLGNEQPNPASNERTPYEFVLLLQANCGEPVNIQKVCMVGDGAAQYQVEVSEGKVAKPNEEAAVRITYQRQNAGGPDQAALVVQSDAENFPTLVIPVCAQVVSDGSDRPAVECQSPVTINPGERDDSLCP